MTPHLSKLKAAAAKDKKEFHHRMPDGNLVLCNGTTNRSVTRKSTHKKRHPAAKKCSDFTQPGAAK